MKLKGTSTLEAVVSMALSGIVLCGLSAAMLHTLRTYKMYTDTNELLKDQLLLSASVNHDFISCKLVKYEGSQLSFYDKCEQPYASYFMLSDVIVKKTTIKLDTFRLSTVKHLGYLEGTEKEGLIDAFKLTTSDDKSLYFSKVYAADILMKESNNIY